MKEFIESLLSENQANKFCYLANQSNPINSLRSATQNVPDKPGLYFVFTENNLNTTDEHLNYSVENTNYTLCYFGKAGGVTKTGKLLKQGLKGRINNVVSDSSRNLIDIKRAVYWNTIMNEYKIDKFYVWYVIQDNPIASERKIYTSLNDENLKYPLMNKLLGRRIFI